MTDLKRENLKTLSNYSDVLCALSALPIYNNKNYEYSGRNKKVQALFSKLCVKWYDSIEYFL